LFFEVELILNTGEFNPQETSDAIKENQAEVSKFADEMESQWNDLEANDASVENDPIFQMAREFMQTGQFANEKQQFDPNIQQPEVEQAEDSEGVNNDWQRTDLD
jgi:hypothetical protein